MIQNKNIKYIIIIIIWMIIVFMFSMENGNKSANTSKTTTIKIVNIITKNLSITEQEKNDIVDKLDPIIRKLAHYTLYTIGGILIINYTDKLDIEKRKKIIYAIIIGILYAITDEIHQYFVPSRSGRILDVCIDTAGVITGIVIFIMVKDILNKIINLFIKAD